MIEDDLQLYKKLSNSPTYLAGEDTSILKFDYRLSVTDADIIRGYINRYFARPSNHGSGEIIEISETKYNDILNVSLYTAVKIIWRVSGKLDDVLGDPVKNTSVRLYTGVITANTLAAQDGDRTLPGLELKLSNPTQFYNPPT